MDVTVCDECERQRSEKKIKRFYRPQEIIPDPEICLLDQGLFCAGIATRAGCGALCPQVNMGCRGCYGPNAGVTDGGAKLIGALASVVDAETPEEIDTILDTLPTRLVISTALVWHIRCCTGRLSRERTVNGHNRYQPHALTRR